jgi:hypothetical protein
MSALQLGNEFWIQQNTRRAPGNFPFCVCADTPFSRGAKRFSSSVLKIQPPESIKSITISWIVPASTESTESKQEDKVMDVKRQPQRSEKELAQQEQTKESYGEKEIEQLRDQTRKQQREGADVNPDAPIPEEARTPKERIATALEELTPDQPGKGSHGVKRTH